MKKISKVILAILLVLTVLKVSENIILSTIGQDYYIATAILNIRTGAGTDYPVFFTLQKGDEVEILSKNGNWYKIKHLEKEGYAYSKYLKYSRTVSNMNFNSFQQKISYIIIGFSQV